MGSPGDAIEDEDQRHLRHHRNRRNRAAVAFDVDQRRRCRYVVIPDVVMNELPVPLQRPGLRVERDDGVGVEVRTFAVAAVIVGRWRTDRREHESSLGIDGEERPDIGARPVFPAVTFPGLDAWFAGARHRVKGPQQFPGPGIPAANIAVETRARRLFAVVAAGDHDVLVDRWGRGQTEAAVHVAAHAGFEIDRPVVSETRGRRAALRVERDQMIAGAGKEARRRGAIARPVRHASATDRGWRCVAPDDFGSFGLERDDIPPRRDVHDAVDHKRRDLQSVDTRVERPRRLQRGDVGRRNLLHRREALAGRIVIVQRPVVDAGGDER